MFGRVGKRWRGRMATVVYDVGAVAEKCNGKSTAGSCCERCRDGSGCEMLVRSLSRERLRKSTKCRGAGAE